MKFKPLENLLSLQLSNGLKVYLKPDHQSPLVSLQAWVRVGSVDEEKSEAGLSHVLEHMLFKGTLHYRAEEISRWIESLGGSLNAETSKEYTHYYIDVPSPGTRRALKILAELLYKATLEPEQWERERSVILEEMKRRNDDPESLLWDLFGETLYQNVRLRQPVIGYPETVQSVSCKTLRGFYERYYRASQTILVIVGDFDTKTMKRWIEMEFGAMPRGGKPRDALPAVEKFTPEEKKIKRPVQQSYAVFGFPTPPASHPHHEILDVLAAILTEGRCSRLVDVLRESKKLVWSVGASNITHEGPGIFGILLECDAKRRVRATEELYRVIKRLRREPPKEAELRRIKNLMQTSWLQSYETFHSQASMLGSFAIDGNIERLNRYLPRILSIEPREIEEVVKTYLSDLPLSSAIIEAA